MPDEQQLLFLALHVFYILGINMTHIINCYNCKFRQKEVRPVRRLVCMKTGEEVLRDYSCKFFEERYDEKNKEN